MFGVFHFLCLPYQTEWDEISYFIHGCHCFGDWGDGNEISGYKDEYDRGWFWVLPCPPVGWAGFRCTHHKSEYNLSLLSCFHYATITGRPKHTWHLQDFSLFMFFTANGGKNNMWNKSLETFSRTQQQQQQLATGAEESGEIWLQSWKPTGFVRSWKTWKICGI